jgi:UDP-N-acetylmuramyl tripeptide synthase
VRQPLFSAVDGAIIRVTAADPRGSAAALRLEGTARDDPADTPAEISLSRTPATETALRLARTRQVRSLHPV